jgi:hypothetical protein
MWALRVLSGPQAGQIFKLKNGTNTIGREPGCNVILSSSGVSKQHAKLDVFDDKIIISDLGSRNGTFANGIKIQSLRLTGSEKLSLHEILFEIIEMSQAELLRLTTAATAPLNYQQASPHLGPYQQQFNHPQNGNVAYQHQQETSSIPNHGSPQTPSAPQSKATVLILAQKYLNEVVLPGVYKLPEIMEFRLVLAIFVGAFILFVTSLSAIPLMRILKASVEKESQRRALTIARTLAKINRAPLMQGIESAVSIEIAQREPGVERALIISNVDGNIIAPASLAGQVPDLPFIHEARREGREIVKQIDDSTIGALVPIEFYNPETGSQAVTACAAVIYNMGSLAVDDARTLSLFIQTFFIALIVGSILFYFLLKTIEFPLVTLNQQLDLALKENHDNLRTTYQFPVLQALVSNINSALSRIGSSDPSKNPTRVEYDRGAELNNLVQLIGFGAIGITAHDLTIQSVNPEFEDRTGMKSSDLVFQTVDRITDQAMRLSIKDLIERALQNPHQIASNDLDIRGETFEIALQAVHGSDQVAYFIVSILPSYQGGNS